MTQEFDWVNWGTIPNERMRPGLERYLQAGILPGQFLQAMISNDMKEFYARADIENIELGQSWMSWMYNEFPSPAWGSRDVMLKWSKKFKTTD